MFTPPLVAPRRSAIALCCAALAAGLTACGGGDSGSTESVSNEAATTYAANAAVQGSDAADAVDTSLIAAEVVVSTQAATASDQATASSAGHVAASAVASVPVSCPGGGSAVLSISGGTALSVLNGQLEAGEVYEIAFTDCAASSVAAAVNGGLQFTVLSATGDALGASLVADDLTVSWPRGSMGVTGSVEAHRDSLLNGDGSTTLTTRLSAPSLKLERQTPRRSGSLSVSALDMTRTSRWMEGVLQSSSFQGSHTVDASGTRGSISYSVSTQGSTSYTADGTPSAGAWTLTLPASVLALTVGDGLATITVDEGKDGSIDRSFSLAIGSLVDAAN